MRKFFYPKNFSWLVNGKSIIKEIFYLYSNKNNINIHINTINIEEIEKLINECKDIEGEEFMLMSLVDCDIRKPRLNENIKMNIEKMINILENLEYIDSLN